MSPTNLPEGTNMDGLSDNAHLPLVNQSETILGVTITFLVTAIFAITLRLMVRFRDRMWGWDDALVAISGITSIVGDSMVCQMPFNGMGKHFWTLSSADKQSYFKYVWATNVTYGASATFIKLAILFQYLRLFNGEHRTARWVTWGVIILTSIWGIIFFFLSIFSCTPVQKNWNVNVNGKCFGWGTKDPDQFFPMWAAHAASNMFLDLVVFLVPMPFLRRLSITTKSRKGLFALFTLGGIVVAISIARMIVLSINRAGTVPTFDVTFHTPAIYLTSVLEVNIAILCASIPIFWPLVTSLTMNKILVVKEVEVRSHRRESDGYTLRDGRHGGAAGLGLATMEFNLTTEEIENKNGRSSRLSVTHIYPPPIPVGARLQRDSALRSHSPAHGAPPYVMGVRPASQESQRKLTSNLTRHESSTSSMTGSPDSKQMGSVNSFNEQWSFEAERESSRRKQGNTTTVERAVSPFDHIKNVER